MERPAARLAGRFGPVTLVRVSGLVALAVLVTAGAGVMSPHDDRGRPAQKRRSESSSVPRIRS